MKTKHLFNIFFLYHSIKDPWSYFHLFFAPKGNSLIYFHLRVDPTYAKVFIFSKWKLVWWGRKFCLELNGDLGNTMLTHAKNALAKQALSELAKMEW